MSSNSLDHTLSSAAHEILIRSDLKEEQQTLPRRIYSAYPYLSETLRKQLASLGATRPALPANAAQQGQNIDPTLEHALQVLKAVQTELSNRHFHYDAREMGGLIATLTPQQIPVIRKIISLPDAITRAP